MRAIVTREKVLEMFYWCEKKFGKSKFIDKRPHVRVYQTKGKSIKNGVYGYYRDGVITIFVGAHQSYKEICCTMIHEYKHYLQSPKEYNFFYKLLDSEGLSFKKINEIHPHEVKARKCENKWGVICFNKLKHKLYKKSDVKN